MIIQIGTEADESRILWKHSKSDEWQRADIDDLIDAYESRPTEWIPVSERLPDIGDTFLVTVMAGTEITTDVANNFGSYIDGFWDTFNDWIEDEEYHVIAWMPLPEPYKGVEEK